MSSLPWLMSLLPWLMSLLPGLLSCPQAQLQALQQRHEQQLAAEVAAREANVARMAALQKQLQQQLDASEAELRCALQVKFRVLGFVFPPFLG